MKILAFDTTAKTATVALTENETLTGLTVLNTPNTHSVTLLPLTEALLRGTGTEISDIDLFVCSAGPGSFTGVRIGAATVKGLAYPSGKPCIGVSSLEALAMNVGFASGIICPVMDARRGQLYNALFESSENGKLTRLTPDRLITSKELYLELSALNRRIYLSGDGYRIARGVLEGLDIAKTPELLRYHDAYNVALLGYRIFMEAGADERKNFTPAALAPVYLRASQAERERAERLSEQESK